MLFFSDEQKMMAGSNFDGSLCIYFFFDVSNERRRWTEQNVIMNAHR